jgi:HK97 family phage portal protein
MTWLSRLNPANWFRRDISAEQFAALGLYTPPAAGVVLTPDVAAGVSAVYCADRVISEDLASLPMVVYRGDGPLDDESHPLLSDRVTRLLARPNPEQTGPVFWSAFQHQANVWGFALAEIVWNGAGQPVELWLIPSPTVRLDREGGQLVYYAPGPGGKMVRLMPHDVLFLPGFSPDGSIGYRLLHTARMTLSTAAAIQQFAAARFKNGSRPSGAIKVQGTLSDQARENMRASWMALYGGPNNAGLPMLLEDGTTWDKFDIDNNDQLQLSQLMEQMVGEVSRFFNISPVKLHQLGRATWSNLETLQRDHVVTTLGPWIAKRDAEINAKLLGPGRHCRHVVDRLLTADTQTRFAAWNTAIAGGWMAPNEARRREDMPPKPGGDDLRLPLNTESGASAAAKKPEPEPAAAEPPAVEEPAADGADSTQPAE